MFVRLPALLLALVLSTVAWSADPIAIGVVINPFNGDRAGPETDGDAQAMLEGGMRSVIDAAGGRIAREDVVALAADEERQYGRWNRFGLASGHLTELAARNAADGLLNLGLYNNCSSLMGMLGGLRHAAAAPRRVGLVWIDAHGDYNTPETTLSGMLGGMPVAIAAGDALHRMRTQAGLDEPIAKQDIVMVGVRDTDPLEQARIEADHIAQLHGDDILALNERFHTEMARLTRQTDVVYVHVDLDVLDTGDSPANEYCPQGGLSCEELARVLTLVGDRRSVRAGALTCYNPGIDRREAAADAAIDAVIRLAALGDPSA